MSSDEILQEQPIRGPGDESKFQKVVKRPTPRGTMGESGGTPGPLPMGPPDCDPATSTESRTIPKGVMGAGSPDQM